jgi:KaiB domain
MSKSLPESTRRTPPFCAAVGDVQGYQIEVVDLLENPHRAADNQMLAVPTLVRKLLTNAGNSGIVCSTNWAQIRSLTVTFDR